MLLSERERGIVSLLPQLYGRHDMADTLRDVPRLDGVGGDDSEVCG